MVEGDLSQYLELLWYFYSKMHATDGVILDCMMFIYKNDVDDDYK